MRAQLDCAAELDEDRLRNLSDWHDGRHGPQFPANGATPSYLHVSGPEFMPVRVAASSPSLSAWSGRRPIVEEMSIQSVHCSFTGMHGQSRQSSSIGAGCGSGRWLPLWMCQNDALPKRNDSASGHPGAFRGRSGPHRGLRPSGNETVPGLIGIGGHLTVPPLPHHRAYGSVPRRFARIRPQQGCRVWGGRASRNGGCVGPAGPPRVGPCASTLSASRRRWRPGTLRVPGGAVP